MRPLDSFAAQRLEGSAGAMHPFWSPDGRYIGFFAGGKLNKMLATGGPVVSLADALDPRGGSWCSTDVILFAPSYQGGLMQVSAGGGQAVPATTVDAAKHTTHRWPSCLPDGKHFLYLATSHQGGRAENNGVYYAALNGKENRLVVPSDAGAQYASGYLLFHAQSSVMAQKLDPASGKLSGEAIAVLDKVRFDSGVWRALFTVSNNGLLGYLPGGAGATGTQLVWYDRTGKILKVVGEQGNYNDPRLSPDGKRLAFLSGDPNWDVWILDLERGARSRITFDQDEKSAVTWSPDGRMLAFRMAHLTATDVSATIHTKAANGSGTDQVLASEDGNDLEYPQYSPDGRYLAYVRSQKGRGLGIYAKPLQGDGAPFAVVSAASPQSGIYSFRISPNGHWIAYDSNESGRFEIYIAPFPRGEGKWQVSASGGLFPAWRGDSRELYFALGSSELWASAISESGGELRIGTPRLLFPMNGPAKSRFYDPASDGQRFLVQRVNVDVEESTALNLMVNWTAELKKK